MNLYEFRKYYRPKSIKPLIGALDELEYEFGMHLGDAMGIRNSFRIIRTPLEKGMYKYPSDWAQILISYDSPRLCVVDRLAEQAFIHISSGKYHIFRGEIRMEAGLELLEIHKLLIEELIAKKFITRKEAATHLKKLNENIEMVG